EFGLNRQGKLKSFSFKFDLLMSQWRYEIITLLRTHYPVLILPPELEVEGNSPQSWTAFLDRNYNRHWNVNVAPNTTHKTHTAKYLGCYVKKPPIAAARLADYTGGDVTFTYLDHRNKSYKDLTLSQTEMMLRILNHVPEKQFKMIRYFGFLSNRLRGRLLPLIYKQLGQEVVTAKTFGFAAMM
ncbi:transposase, partial [Photobacterium phosphoreum]|uniref:IS91 family transposase n=1 Tax=Photobacterium phosphoreum TaxID=659 RepID=UPI000AD8C1ED